MTANCTFRDQNDYFPFCLQELSKILESIQDKGRSVFPVFYMVDPSDVRKLKGTYGEAMDDKWKASLHQVASLSGFHYMKMKGEKYEHKFIGEIVEGVLSKIKVKNTIALPVGGDYLVGLEHQKQHVISLLNGGSDDEVNMVGIHGIGGIGKTTLSLEVYNSIVHQFQSSCFLKDVRENTQKKGLEYLQNNLLSQIIGENIEIPNVTRGISILRERLQHMKVLLLLDDVDNEEQLQAIAGKSNWFGLGSRVIITTRNQRLLTLHGIERRYEVKELNNIDAFELVRRKAFRNEKTDEDFSDYVHVLKCAVAYASGLPLALEVMGSHLFTKTIEQCKDALDRYERIPDRKIQMVLQLSFDTLEVEEKSVFLDIACCFKGYTLTRVAKILHVHHGEIMKDHINVLVEKSLIKIDESGKVTLHDLLEDMGKEIVRQESPEDPGKRSRLWASEDINQVLQENKEASKIGIIYVNDWIKLEGNGDAFNKMNNLKTLLIDEPGHFFGSLGHLPNSLRVLDFYSPYFTEQPVFLNKKFQNLRVFNFDSPGHLLPIQDQTNWITKFCKKILYIETEDQTNFPNLEELSIKNCWGEFTSDKSVGFMSKLKILRIISCRNIKSVPPLNCPSLVELDLSGCSFLESFPLTVNGFVENLKILRLQHCSTIRIIPLSMLHSLEELNLNDCISLESFSHVVGLGEKLKTMSVRSCIKLRSIPPLKLTSLEELDLTNCTSLQNFPLVIDEFLGKLKILRLENCHNLKSIPPLKLDVLEELNLSNCSMLESFPPVVDGFLGKLKALFAKSCYKLRSIPPLKLDSLETLDLSHCYSLESFSSAGHELLENIKFFNIECCIILKSIPSLRVTSLKIFNISYCLSLESFPEILGDMRNIPQLHLDNIPKKLLPLALQNLTLRDTIYPCYCGRYFSDRFSVVSMLAESTIEGEEIVSPMKSSHVGCICLYNSKLSDEYWSISFMLFANVKELHLANNLFTVLPKCMEKCKFLWRLVLDDCVKLKEIKGIPPCLRVLSALNCQSLTSSSKSKLLNQELHEVGNTWFLLPLAKIPEWFDHQCSESEGFSISFWFRNKLPDILLCVGSPSTWNYQYQAKVIINGNTFFIKHGLNIFRRSFENRGHLHLFHMQLENFNDKMDNPLLENKWNYAQVDIGFRFMYSGIHVLKEKSSMEDIQFTNPRD